MHERTLTCPLCEAMCGLRATVEDNRVTRLRGDPEDPLSRGALCPKALALPELHEDPDRLRTPLRKTASGDHAPIGWDEALDEAAERLHAVRRAHGPHAVATYFGNPLVHNTGGILFGILFSRALRSRNTYSATSLDQLPQMLAAWSMFGHQLMLPVPDVDRSRLMVVIGANPVVSNGSLVSAPGFRERLRALRARGGRLVVIDPRRTETARLADQHLFVRPGTDALLLAAVARTILEELGPRLGRLERIVKRLDEARAWVAEFPPERVAEATGVPPEAIRRLAAELTETEGAVLYGRIGICTQAFGGLASWLVNLINILAGNLDVPGGAMFTRPALDALAVASRLGRTGSFARYETRVRGLPEFGGELPTAALAEEIEQPGEDRIRALVTAAGNPVLSAPNGRRLDAALSRLDFMVSVDPYLNETTRHADLILPPVSALERDHYDLVFLGLAVRDTAKFSPAVLERPPGALDDGEIFVELATRLEARSGFGILARARRGLVRALGTRGLLALGLRLGPRRIRLKDLLQNPSGLDFGPLEPRLPERLFTADGRVDLAPACFGDDLDRLRAALDEPTPELVLIGRRELRSNNSWMHNAPSLVSGRARCTLRIHPDDAAPRGLRTGDRAELRTGAGAVVAPVEVTEELMPGVVSLPHGYGHGRAGTRLQVAADHAGASLNDVMEDHRVDGLTGNAAFSGQPVQVSRTT